MENNVVTSKTYTMLIILVNEHVIDQNNEYNQAYGDHSIAGGLFGDKQTPKSNETLSCSIGSQYQEDLVMVKEQDLNLLNNHQVKCMTGLTVGFG